MARRHAWLLAACIVAGPVLGRWAPAGHECEHVTIRYRSAPGPAPKQGIAWAIDRAQVSVRAMLYSCTDGDIADALVRARAKGRDVRVMIDDARVKEAGSVIPILVKAGIPVVTDAHHPIFHHKDWVIDGYLVITGSYNPTHQARDNAESSIEIRCKGLADDLIEDWDIHLPHTRPHPEP